MYGSNEYGTGYYGQGPAEGTTFTLASVSTAVIVTASITFKLLINQTVSAVVTANASLARLFARSIAAAVTVSSTASTLIVLGLNLKKAATKFLNSYRTTKDVAGFKNDTEMTTQKTTTRRVTEA